MAGLSGLFSTPKSPAPVLMPDPQDPVAKDQQRMMAISASQRSGRASTILNGTDSYSGTTTGTK